MRNPRLVLLAAGALAAVALFLLLRPEGDDDAATPATGPTTAAATAAATTTTAATTTARPAPRARPSAVTIRITIRGGRPEGGIRRATVAQGRRVRLVVRSDVSDHVHLHGYDVFRDVGPGAPAQLAFRASIPGQFEVELEDRGLPIADITVEP